MISAENPRKRPVSTTPGRTRNVRSASAGASIPAEKYASTM
jgi:hypothetical protein